MSASTVPTLREHTRKFYHEKLRDWLDFRHYWRQRRLILNNPEILFDPPKGKHWKSPLEFAFYGLVVVGLAVQGAGWAVEKVFPDIHVGNRVLKEAIEERNNSQQLLDEVQNGDSPFSGYETQVETQSGIEKRIEELDKVIAFEERYDHTQEAVTTVATRWMFILASGVFAFICKGRRTQTITLDIKVAYCYIVTGSYFFISMIDMLLSRMIVGTLLVGTISYSDMYSGSALYGLILSIISCPVILQTAARLRRVGHSDMYMAQVLLRVGVVQAIMFGVGQVILNLVVYIYVEVVS